MIEYLEYIKYYYYYYPSFIKKYLVLFGVMIIVESFIIKGIQHQQLKNSKCLFMMGSSVYFYALFLITIGIRIPFSGTHVKLISFFFSDKGISSQHFLNLILFVPFGIIQYHYFIKRKYRQKIVYCLVVSTVLSVIIESIQLLTRRGYFEVDDILLNVLGSIIGVIICISGKKCLVMIKK